MEVRESFRFWISEDDAPWTCSWCGDIVNPDAEEGMIVSCPRCHQSIRLGGFGYDYTAD